MIFLLWFTTALALAAQSKQLAIVQATIHQTDDGPASAPGAVFVPGETIFFSAFLDRYQVSTAKRVSLTYRVEALDARDVPIIEAVSGKIDEELAPQDKEWRPKIRQEIFIPPLADSGKYRVRLSAKDELNGTSAVREAVFAVKGHEVEPSATLVIRSIQFHRSEDDSQPLQIASYRPGDTVWCRFDLTGYKLGAGNELHVSYVVSVTAPSGKVLFTQPEPTMEKSSSFYPKRYTPSMFNLSLTPTIAKGEYTITIKVSDHLGGQEFSSTPGFRVE